MAVFHRLVEISQRDDVKEGIIERAALGFSGRRDELADREAALKQQLLTAASRRRNLLDVFADLGKKTPDSVREEILQVEKDEKIYHTALAKLDDEQALLDQQAESAKAFMATWAHVGDILAATSAPTPCASSPSSKDLPRSGRNGSSQRTRSPIGPCQIGGAR